MNTLRIKHPIIQAPMAGGGITTPELVAEVSNAGALGSIGAGMMTPQAILEMIAAIRGLTDKPFNVNLFVLHDVESDAQLIARSLDLMEPFQRELGLAPGAVPAKFSENFADQLAAVRESPPAVISFTFGIVDRKTIAELHKDGSLVMGTATNAAEARAWADVGADFICAQGAEAGGHRGTSIGEYEDGMTGTLPLVRKLVKAVDTPVIAAGGIMDGRASLPSSRWVLSPHNSGRHS